MHTLTVRVAAFAFVALAGAPSFGQDEAEDLVLVGEPVGMDLASDALAVMQERCVSCHTEAAEDRKAVRSWPDALDVQAMIDDEVIEVEDPDLSFLLELIDDGEMPPEDCDIGPVTDDERATLLAWIAAGAPPWPKDTVPNVSNVSTVSNGAGEGSSEGTDAAPPPPLQETAPPVEREAATVSEHEFAWHDLGVLHPALAHFPVGLLLAAVLAEILVACGAGGLRTASRFCAWLGFIGALVTGATGWLQAEGTIDRHGLLEPHRWLGVASAVAGLLLALSLEGRARGGGSRPLHVALVLATAVLVSLTGYWGGSLTWGSDHFSDLTFLPAFLR